MRAGVPLMRAVVTVGLPGCGKSTFARGLLQPESPDGPAELNLDALREKVCGDATNQSATRAAIALRNRLFHTYAHERRDVIVSDTHARRKHRTRVIKLLRKLGYHVELVFFDVGIETCLQRNAGRERQVPIAAIEMMAGLLSEHPPVAHEADAFQVIRLDEDPLLRPDRRQRAAADPKHK